ncbi:MAG: winged helix-turn-helix transcriptional regulator, partial [Ilumatobacteraceae bacterium]
MAGYGQFCPVAKTSELLCERWVPLIVRELLSGSRRFSEIQRGVPLISPALLSKRLRQLEAAGVIVRSTPARGADYTLTEAGWELYPIIEAMGVWGQRWARSSYTPDELDPALLMWDMRRMLQPAGLAPPRTVVEFRFAGAPAGKSTFWLVVDDSIDLCLIDPGHPVDLWVRADLRCLTQVWMGDRTMRDVIVTGAIALDGPRSLVHRFPDWLGQHPVLAKVAPAT